MRANRGVAPAGLILLASGQPRPCSLGYELKVGLSALRAERMTHAEWARNGENGCLALSIVYPRQPIEFPTQPRGFSKVGIDYLKPPMGFVIPPRESALCGYWFSSVR